jgi:hypothetical protein
LINEDKSLCLEKRRPCGRRSSLSATRGCEPYLE